MREQLVKVKICGLKDHSSLQACARLQADWVGFVFYKNSPRYVTPSVVSRLLNSVVNLRAQTVGLFVRPSLAQLREVLDSVPLDIVQLYDTPERALAFQKEIGLPVWQSWPVRSSSDLPYQTQLQRLVIESAPPGKGRRPGGNGRAVDWSLLKNFSPSFPWILAGGLTPSNVQEALEITQAPAVDVSSGVEKAPGVKDSDLIAQFIHRAKSSCGS